LVFRPTLLIVCVVRRILGERDLTDRYQSLLPPKQSYALGNMAQIQREKGFLQLSLPHRRATPYKELC